MGDILKEKKTFWSELIGSPSNFSLESRIFHSISLSLTVLTTMYVPYNLYAGLYIGSLSAFIFSLFFSSQYYLSRFRGKAHNNILFGLAGILIFGINYFTNSGIDGATDLIWPVYLLLVFAISPYRQHMMWLAAYLLCFLIVHALEYYYPSLVRHPFTEGKGQFIDRVTAFPIPAIATYIIIKFIRRSYDNERKAAEDKTIAVRTLMSVMSHDLRTPLMNIKAYLELLRENDLDSAERAALEKTLLKSTDSAAEMLSNLLRWSKSQMEGPKVVLLKVNLLEVLQGTLEMEKIHAAKKDISLSHHIPPDVLVIADVDMLQLVVRNMISNAIKFTQQGGLIRIDAELIDGECKVTVSDNGRGIAQAKRENIFSINQEPSFGTNNERGVGLGLVLCKEFTERQGGRIGFESNPDQGSSFFIYLPLAFMK